MKPYFQNDFATIYHGDSRDVLSEVEDASVSLLLTDPPYGIAYVSKNLAHGHAIAGDGVRQGMRLVRQVLHAGADKLLDPAHLYLFCSWQSWPDFFDAAGPYMKVKQALIWWKDRGGVGDTAAGYAPDFEVILYGNVGRKALNGRRDGAVLAGFPPPGNSRLHPTEKPVDLLRYLIRRSTQPGELVGDWFMGAGSTLEAAVREGRRAVGIEIEERHCESAAQRLERLRPEDILTSFPN